MLNDKDEDGEPVVNAFAACIAGSFRECLDTGEMLPCMREGVVSVLFKKGRRDDLGNYRPITVLSSLYKILARSMVLSFSEAVPYLVSQSQGGFQSEKYIGELSRLTQDLLHYIDETDGEGLVLSCDQAKAYDLVSWPFMHKVLEAMEVPPDFVRLVRCCYTNNTVRVKVNGHLGCAASPTNGVKQGCPFSPLAYICVFQTFLSLLNLSDLQGIEIPGALV